MKANCLSLFLSVLSYNYSRDTRNNTSQKKMMDQNIGQHGSCDGKIELKNKTEKSNKCKECSFATSRADHLRTHLRTHSGEKPNKCKQCEYACSDPSALRTHFKIHSGEKPNKCNQCQYASGKPI